MQTSLFDSVKINVLIAQNRRIDGMKMQIDCNNLSAMQNRVLTRSSQTAFWHLRMSTQTKRIQKVCPKLFGCKKLERQPFSL